LRAFTLQFQNNALLKHIVLFGAGKSSTFLIEYLVGQLPVYNWTLTVLDADRQAAQDKIGAAENAIAVEWTAENDELRNVYVQSADIVISLLPPSLHYQIAIACIKYCKHLLTASYVDKKLQEIRHEIKEKKLLFLCEMGLDPGIDHMSAMHIIHRLQKEDALITSFRSHCGGLVAPESNDNPWRHKLSWNTGNIVLAGKTGAHYRENNHVKVLSYGELFDSARLVSVPGLGKLAWYPNRDSLAYIDVYNLNSARNFVRTTLRYPEFCAGWNNIVRLKLTDEAPVYNTNGMSIKAFFLQHLRRYGFSPGIEKQDNLLVKQLFYLGFDDDRTFINRGMCSAADVLRFAMENTLALKPHDNDMVVMLHEIEYEKDDHHHTLTSTLILNGKDGVRTAMAKTVGLPLAIAAKLILLGRINVWGLHIPVLPEIYEPVMEELKSFGIRFTD
jgi:saccharopine dehydrogenase-like NADP-dependent oxidoreductase